MALMLKQLIWFYDKLKPFWYVKKAFIYKN